MRGELISLQLFDLGGTLSPKELRETLRDRAPARSIPVGKGTPGYVEFPQPFIVGHPSLSVRTPRGLLPAEVTLYYYPIGAVSVRFRVPLEIEDLAQVRGWNQFRVEIGNDALTFEAAARQIVLTERALWSKAVVEPYTEQLINESYTVFAFREAGTSTPDFLASHRQEIAGLLKAEEGTKLFEKEVSEALKKSFSYYDDDVIIMDWDAAFIVDPSSEWEDLVFVLEIANLQLLEFRAYDDYLDEAIARAYDDLERLFRRAGLFGGAHRAVHELSLLRIEFAELADEVDNITKFLGDWFLARVFQAAGEKFHLADWRAAVDEKLGTINNLYQLANSERDTRRLLVLEIMIVVLFVVDLIALVFL